MTHEPCLRGHMDDAVEWVRQPGKYEGESPIVALIDTCDLYDATSGDVEAPTGWFGLAGRWVITTTSGGFTYGERFRTRENARTVFDSLDCMYCEWGDNDD